MAVFAFKIRWDTIPHRQLHILLLYPIELLITLYDVPPFVDKLPFRQPNTTRRLSFSLRDTQLYFWTLSPTILVPAGANSHHIAKPPSDANHRTNSTTRYQSIVNSFRCDSKLLHFYNFTDRL